MPHNHKTQKQKMDDWRTRETFLPRCLRGSDNQNAIFKASTKHRSGFFSIAIIDFLWFMAERGYVLRAATKSADYIDIDETIAQSKKEHPETVDDMLERMK